jgi:hypothetical protein
MPIVRIVDQNPLIDGRQSENALLIQRGMTRFLLQSGFSVLPEFPLVSGRRADLLAIDRKGRFTLVEIKSSVEDFRVDRKWPEYRPFCDFFLFATSPSVPADIFPQEEGLIIADGFGAEMVRHPLEEKMAPASRKALTLRFARLAAQRAERVTQYALTNGIELPDLSDDT